MFASLRQSIPDSHAISAKYLFGPVRSEYFRSQGFLLYEPHFLQVRQNMDQ